MKAGSPRTKIIVGPRQNVEETWGPTYGEPHSQCVGFLFAVGESEPDLRLVHSAAQEGVGLGGREHNAATAAIIARDTQHEDFGHESPDILRGEINHT
jgi:hypothetical protein